MSEGSIGEVSLGEHSLSGLPCQLEGIKDRRCRDML